MDIFSLFSTFGITSHITTINGEVCEVYHPNFDSKITVCHKALTFGGRNNLPDELRVQIMYENNNIAFREYEKTGNAALLGIHDSEDIVCAWKLKLSNATQGTISKQIKRKYIEEAKKVGFVQAPPNRSGEYVCVFRKEFIYFYLKNLSWLHDAPVQDLNEHYVPEKEEDVSADSSIDEGNRMKGGMNVLLYGVPGCGKSFIIKTKYCRDADAVERVVFHPDYTYGDFVGQILPLTDAETGKIRYEFSAGPFTRVLSDAYNNPDKKYCLIIEEINRGNAPAIFGDIFQLLDRDENGDGIYEITNADVAAKVYICGQASKKIKLPSNLFIFATMNTSDQNVFTLDTAFQRRWNMRMAENNVLKSEIAQKRILDTNLKWAKFADAINGLIIAKNVGMTSSEDKRLGAYFVSEKDLHFFTTADGITQEDADERNHNFPEKVLKYLWDDAFKFTRDEVFKSNYDSLEKLIKAFEDAKGDERFNIFADDIFGLH